MSAEAIYQHVAQHIHRLLGQSLSGQSLSGQSLSGQSLPKPSVKRLILMVLGMVAAKSCAPAHIALMLEQMGLGSKDSLERRLRRTQSDPKIDQQTCFHPMARWHLNRANTETLIIALDPTTKRDKFVMVALSVSYRGRCLPLLWTIWPGNTSLEGDRFWQRIKQLLDRLALLVPRTKNIVIVADRAFGTAVFTDLVQERGWHYIVRVQDQTRCQDDFGHELPVRHLVRAQHQRAKRSCRVFKKQGWRAATVLVYWGHHAKPLCLVSSLGSHWHWLNWYRSRATIEAMFRDYKSHGWHWEQTQVRSEFHLEHLLVGMAWATWLTVGQGVLLARSFLSMPGSGSVHQRQKQGRLSLFTLGLSQLGRLLWQRSLCEAARSLWWSLCCPLPDWKAPEWSRQIQQKGSREYFYAH